MKMKSPTIAFFGIFRMPPFSLFPIYFCLLISACSPSKPRADLCFVQSAEPETIDPAMVTDQVSMRIEESLFEGLCRNNEKGQSEPGVAERWEVSEDKKHYTFHLRANAMWSNGEQVTAKDFVRSWQRALEPAQGADYASQLYLMKNAKAYNESTLKDFNQVGVHAVDDRTLSVDLENPTPYFIDMCAFATLAPVHMPTLEKHGGNWIKPGNVVTNGPYLLDEWKLDDHIRLMKSPLYWDAANVKMATVEVKPINDANAALNYFTTGAADLMMDKGMVPTSLTKKLKEQA
ncbi:MAG: Oligopeptide transport system substrate-binding protein, partial [Verrucomicrobiaceae bacterium]|nr:Oligopeptide transport system substrate-binding protein [Verrucomicrobiaceae bacterium]